MKNILFTLCLLMFFGASATDLYVQEYGLGGAYVTIQAAIDAATSGDRIIIYPKENDEAYVENLINNSNKNLSLLSSSETVRWKLNGQIHSGVNTVYQVSGAEIFVSGVNTAVQQGSGANGIFRLAGCKITGFVNGFNNLYLDNDSIYNGRINTYGGRISGCYIVPYNGGGFEAILTSSNYPGTDTIEIVGNTIDYTGINNTAMGLYWGCAARYGYVANNLFLFNQHTGSYKIYIGNGKNNLGNQNAFVNNTIIDLNATNTPVGVYFGVTSTYWRGVNNVVYKPTGGYTNGAFYISPLPNVFDYNYVKVGSGAAFSGTTPNATNKANSNVVLNGDGVPQAGSDVIDGGHPNIGYLDLDLSRNDAGCFGGSYTRENFKTPETGSRVLYLKAPRTVFSGQTITISGEGLDK